MLLVTIHSDIIEALCNTPLIRLRRVSYATGCDILVKAEFMNPGQSVKDRAALFIVRAAERSGMLRPGGMIVEGTPGTPAASGVSTKMIRHYEKIGTASFAGSLDRAGKGMPCLSSGPTLTPRGGRTKAVGKSSPVLFLLYAFWSSTESTEISI